MKIKHSILVITYNQADLIPYCLDSLLNQGVKPYEVVICDDCSTDNTYEVLQKYKESYPDLIKVYRNEPNLGVFNNINKIKKLATGDFINFVSGDDMLPAGVLEKYSKFIEEKALKGTQLIMDRKWISFMHSYDVATIPRYILLDKEGKIINLNMPRPSNPQCMKILKSLKR